MRKTAQMPTPELERLAHEIVPEFAELCRSGLMIAVAMDVPRFIHTITLLQLAATHPEADRLIANGTIADFISSLRQSGGVKLAEFLEAAGNNGHKGGHMPGFKIDFGNFTKRTPGEPV